MVSLLRRILLGPCLSVTLAGRRRASPIVLGSLLLCCCGTLSIALVDSGLRQAGLLPTYVPSPTRSPVPSAAPRPLSTASPPPTTARPAAVAPTAWPTATATAVGPRANSAANLRAGPGTNHAIIGGAAQGQALDIIARSPASDWYQLRGGAWIFGELVTAAPVVPVAAVVPTAPPAPLAVPTARGLPSAAASNCDCDHGDILNCDDFTAWDAQACYLRCKQLTGRDVHRLDRDGDGNACEYGR